MIAVRSTLILSLVTLAACHAPDDEPPGPADMASADMATDSPDLASSPGEVALIAGTPATGFVDGAGAAARFNGPGGGVLLPGGAVIVSDTFNAVLRRIELSDGKVTTIAGRVQVLAAADGVGAAARLQSPRSMTARKDGSAVYLADGPTIRRLDLPSYRLTTIAGSAAMAGYLDGPAMDARLGYLLHALELSADEKTLYIADRSNRVLRTLELEQGVVRTLAGSVYMGANQAQDGVGAAARFSGVGGLTRVGDVLYVADTFNHTVRRVALADGAVTTVVGQAGMPGLTDGPKGTARLRTPQGLVALGQALYSVSFDGVLRRIDLADHSVRTVLGDASDARSVDGAGASARLGLGFSQPIVEGEGALLYHDRSANSLRRITLADLSVRTIAGAEEPEADTDGPVARSRLRSPVALTATRDGKQWFVADAASHVIRRIDRDAGQVTTLVGKAGVEGAQDGPLSTALLTEPAALCLDERRRRLYFTSDATVRMIDLEAGVVTTVAGAAGEREIGDGVGVAARFVRPVALSLDEGGGKLYIAESAGESLWPMGRAALRVIELGSAKVSTLLGGAPDEEAKDGPIKGATLNAPQALSIDPAAQRLYVAEAALSIVRVVDLAQAEVSTLAGKRGESGPGDGPLGEARFDYPAGLALRGGALYIADEGGHTIRRVDLAAGVVNTWLGDPSLAGGFMAPQPFQQATLYYPGAPVTTDAGLGYIGEGAVYLARPGGAW